MKIAIPFFKNRIAPHFGTTSAVLLVEIQGDTVVQKIRSEIAGKSAMEMARTLFEMGISTLICGGIETYFKDWLTRKGVTVLDNQKGPVPEAFEKFMATRRFFKTRNGDELP